MAFARSKVNILLDFFLPHPSLSITSASHMTRGRLLGPPRNRRIPGFTDWLSGLFSVTGCESRTVIVRELSPGAEVAGRRAVDADAIRDSKRFDIGRVYLACLESVVVETRELKYGWGWL